MSVLIFIVALLSVPVQALEGPCATDAASKCSGMEWGKGLGMCLQSKKDLAPGCRVQVDEMKTEMKDKFNKAKDACKEDADKFCGKIEKKQGYFKELKKCMDSHGTELSEKCSKFRNKKESR